MANEVVVTQEDKSEKELALAFSAKIVEREALVVMYKDLISQEITNEVCLEAGDLLKKLVKVRTGIAAIHKAQKDYSLSYGKLCDSWKNKETLPVTQMEEKLSKLKNFFEDQEKERIIKVQAERAAELLPYNEEAEHMKLSDIEDDVWPAYLATKKKVYEEAQAVILKEKTEREAKEKAEKEENARLKAELDKKDADAAAALKAVKDAQDKKDAEAKVVQDKKDADAAAALKVANDKVKKAEEKEVKEAQEKEVLLNAGDEDKFKSFLTDLEELKNKYAFKSVKNQKTFSSVNLLIDKVINFIKEKS